MTSKESKEAYRARRHEQQIEVAKPKAADLVAQYGDRIVEFIREVRETRGAGPTWGELRRVVGLGRGEVNVVLQELRRRGRVTYTQEEGSLRAEGKPDGPYIERADTHLPMHPEA